jgi:hypothetical protein
MLFFNVLDIMSVKLPDSSYDNNLILTLLSSSITFTFAGGMCMHASHTVINE